MEDILEVKVQERAVLVGLNADCFTKEQTATDETLEELEALLETAGGFCTGKIIQNRHTPDPHSFIGEGKAQEVRMLVEATASTMVVFDNELSPGNIRALEECRALGINDSMIHVDFMIGCDTMNIDAVCADGNTVPVFRNGNWAF